jgi:carboxymethylenebutenolidase
MTQRSLEQILLADGTRLPLTIAAPESAIRGGIIVEPEARGVTDAVWQLAAGLAGEGWLAVIPHLYHRVTATPWGGASSG